MDKNTVTGFILIALVVIGFSWYSRPSEAELRQMAQQDSIAAVEREKAEAEQKLKAELEEQQHQIDLIPIEIQDLRKEYKEKETEIQELNNAKILYSPARIKQQEQEVKRLQGEIERLTTRSNSLTEKTEKLKAERIELADVFPKLESRALEYAKSVLVSLEPGISDKLEEVEQIREDAERLSDNLQQCNKLRSQYQGWLRGVETPLERLMSAMDEPESKVLKETLDPTKCNSIHTQITNARLAVESLDHVLKELMEAYGEDVARIYREAMAHES